MAAGSTMFTLVCFISLYCLGTVYSQTRDKWLKWGQEELTRSLKPEININKAKNVILFLGDGMGISTITAARFYRSQLEKDKKIREGDAALEFEKFPNVALSKTYNANRQTPGSASTATALLSGVKINQGTIGVDNTVVRHQCASQTESSHLTSILDWSMAEGKSTGIITTARLSHASPAANYGHTASRAWEGDVDMTDVIGKCKDLSLQLFEDNKNITVVMGGGRRTLLPKNFVDPQTNASDGKQRLDGRNLIEEWKTDKKTREKSYQYTTNKKELNDVDASKTDYLLGVFATSHMDYEIDRDASDMGQPSIAEMTKKAIQILKKNNNGFFLFVEGARIDHGHHETKAKKAIHDVLAFDDAVKAGLDETDDEDTLIVVTGDHSHVFNIAGYPAIGNDIFGLVNPMDSDDVPKDKMPYTTLVYANGENFPRNNLTGVDTTDKNYQQPAAVPVVDETHGGEDVAIFARGPMAHLFHGVHEQNYVAHVMAYASCVGMNKEHCTNTFVPPCIGRGNSISSSFLILVISLSTAINRLL